MTELQELLSTVNGEIYGVWFLIGAALVFWMQAGFAMVEAGFTRAKNTGNIIMKNLMDFCIGTCTFILIGFGLLLGEDLMGFIGKPGFDIFTSYADFDWSNFVFNLVFCATTATIVSGAMAERTKFRSYCVYSGVISALIYPVEAHWIWGGGWLAQMGFHDFAGSCAIHMVGGISALIGAKMLGPRIGKFTKDKQGNITKVNAFPGHNLTVGALGVFILWLGWYGFNGAAATSLDDDDLSGDRDSGVYDIYMGEIRQARCIHVSECVPCRACGHHGRVRCDGCLWRDRDRRGGRTSGGVWRVVSGLQAPC